MRRTLTTLAAGLALAAAAVAQPYGMGPGMMGGYGPDYDGRAMGGYGMGPGMMFGDYPGDAYAGLDLTPEQRKKIADIREEANRTLWQLMGTMHQQGYHMQGMFGAGPFDEDAARKSFQAMTQTRTAMFEAQLDARKRIDAVLTKEQRERLSRYWTGR